MAVVTDVGYGPVLLALPSVPIVAGAAAAYSGDIAGQSYNHPWLWIPGTFRALADLYSSPGSLTNKARQLLRMLW
ncbi:hypothetical protein [Streptomyces sp. NPDC093261]|uniref:hypothetical protein n=1 Tax=Streptomyces sp. NPDC093261 TaxID=3366037 RepID=UPI0038086FAB